MYLRQALTIAAKDLRAEWRTREAVTASLAFMLVILVLFSFAFDPGNSNVDIHAIAGGLLWLAYAFAAALALNRSFARELQNDCLDALMAATYARTFGPGDDPGAPADTASTAK